MATLLTDCWEFYQEKLVCLAFVQQGLPLFHYSVMHGPSLSLSLSKAHVLIHRPSFPIADRTSLKVPSQLKE